jgi:hypothetical protein
VKKFEDLLAGELCISLINEALDFEVDEAVSALERAKRRWGSVEVLLKKEPNNGPN